MTTVRLSPDMEKKLEIFSRKRNKSKTEIIKEALSLFFYREEVVEDSFSVGEEYFGKYGSNEGSRSVTYKSKIKEKLNDKHRSH